MREEILASPITIAQVNFMITKIRGEFEVKLASLPSHDTATGSLLGRRSIDKQFHGALEATSIGEMLSAGTSVKGSVGYVAIERVSGKLDNKKGTFVFQHFATMNRGEPILMIVIVPDSGTGELTGLTGKMSIEIKDGKHFYDFEYSIVKQ